MNYRESVDPSTQVKTQYWEDQKTYPRVETFYYEKEGLAPKQSFGSTTFLSYQKFKEGYAGPRIKGSQNPASWDYFEARNDVTTWSKHYEGWATWVITGAYDSVYTIRWPSVSLDLDVSKKNAAIMKLRSRLANASDLNFGVSIGELPETIEFISETALSIAKSYRHARRGKFKNALKELGVTTESISAVANKALDHHMAYRYAVVPLMGEVTAALETLSDSFTQGGVLVLAKASYDQDGSARGTAVNEMDRPGVYRKLIRGSYTVYAKVTSPAVYRANQYGMLNPGVLLWELTPLSFIPDWFFPIGDYLQTLTDTMGMSFEKGWHTEKTESVWSSGDEFQTKATAIRRVILKDFPFPSIPNWSPNVSIARFFDAVALMRR